MKRLQLGFLLPCLLLGLAGGPLRADQPKLPHVDFTDQKLDNGLRVIIAVDRTAPVFGIDVTYNVGSRNERPGRTLQTTALVHEAYLRLVDETKVEWRERAQFFAMAAQMMRRILVDAPAPVERKSAAVWPSK